MVSMVRSFRVGRLAAHLLRISCLRPRLDQLAPNWKNGEQLPAITGEAASCLPFRRRRAWTMHRPLSLNHDIADSRDPSPALRHRCRQPVGFDQSFRPESASHSSMDKSFVNGLPTRFSQTDRYQRPDGTKSPGSRRQFFRILFASTRQPSFDQRICKLSRR